MTTITYADRPFGQILADLGARYANLVWVDADLQRATETDLFEERFPERYFDVGVAEANMVGVATGLAQSGKVAFCGDFGCFMSQRVCDQVAISVAYCRSNVKMFGFDAGLASGGNGASHQGMLDLAIMRSMPNMTVYVPGDATETRAIMEWLVEHPGPAYMRAPRGKTPVIFEPGSLHFQPGKAVQVREGRDVSIIACGTMLPRALKAADDLAAEGISARVINMSSLKPLDAEAIVAAAEETRCIVTAEDHNIYGGLGSAVAEVLCEQRPALLRVGIRDTFGEVGPVEWLAEKYGISAGNVAQAVRAILKRVQH